MPSFLADFLSGLERGTRGLPQALQTSERLGLQRRKLESEQQESELERQRKAAKLAWDMALASGDKGAMRSAYERMEELELLPSQRGPQTPDAEPEIEPPPVAREGAEFPGGGTPTTPLESTFEEIEARKKSAAQKEPALRNLPIIGDPQPDESEWEERYLLDRTGEPPANPVLKAIFANLDAEKRLKEIDAETKDLKFKKAQLDYDNTLNKHKDWKPVGGGEWFWRMDDKGNPQVLGNPLFNNEIYKIYPDEGFYVTNAREFVPIPDEMRNLTAGSIKGDPGKSVHSIDWKAGLILYKNGEVKPLKPEDMQAIIDAENRLSETKMEEAAAKYKLMKDHTSWKYSLNVNQKNAERLSGLMKHVDKSVSGGTMTPDQAISFVETQISYMPEFKYDKTGILESLRDHTTMIAMQVGQRFNASQKEQIADAAKAQADADEILHLLGKQHVQKHVGRVAGTIHNFRSALTGEANVHEDVVAFDMLLSNLRDEIVRARTGAVINEQEEVMYSKMLGSEVKEVEALQARLKTLIYIMQGRRNVLWEQGLNASFGEEAGRAYYHKIPQFQSKYEDGIAVGLSDKDME